MFGQSASSAILGNQDIGTIWTWGDKEAVGRAEFKGKDAAKFADRMGFEKAVSSATATVTTTINSMPDAQGPGFMTDISEELSNKRYTYAKKGANSSYTISKTSYGESKVHFGILDASSKDVRFEQRQYSYSGNKPNYKMNQNTFNFILKTSVDIISIYLDSKKK